MLFLAPLRPESFYSVIVKSCKTVIVLNIFLNSLQEKQPKLILKSTEILLSFFDWTNRKLENNEHNKIV
jgi:hypothetical protein